MRYFAQTEWTYPDSSVARLRHTHQVGDRIWLVSFMQYDLGYFDDETCRLEPIENPFGPKVLARDDQRRPPRRG
jgi:hypothetical protein